MTEEKMMEYPKLYKKYVVSIMLTEDPTRLSETETGYYISKRTIYENLYITKDYNSKHTYMFEYPAMSYDLSADAEIRENMRIINNCIIIKFLYSVLIFVLQYKNINSEWKICCFQVRCHKC